jgi:DNA-binding MarR family transcriptional regulator/N-acetylglutamate synthase-like GNAT family acetyltransferase
MSDILRERGYVFLGSRLKRLGERMQADVLNILEQEGLPMQPSQAPVLAALDQHGPSTVGDIVRATGVSQPAITRSLALLTDLGLVETVRAGRDLRHRTVSLTEAGHAALARSRLTVWPRVESAVIELCAGRSGPFLQQIDAIEDALAATPLNLRGAAAAPAGLSIRRFTDDLARDFHDINAQWIRTMFTLEPTDREVLENPRARIIEPGGDILFVEAKGLGVIGTCALQKTGDRQFELTKMGVLDAARGRKAGEYLLQAMLRRAAEMEADLLYLLTNSACAAAIHLYEKLGFVHDSEIMRNFGARYQRCDVAMRYHGAKPILSSSQAPK